MTPDMTPVTSLPTQLDFPTRLCVTVTHMCVYVSKCEIVNSVRETRETGRKGKRGLGQRNRDGKQIQHNDWSLIKGNVAVLLEFTPTTHGTPLPFDDKIITNSSAQHFPYKHFNALIHTCIKRAVFNSIYVHLVKIFQTNEINKVEVS